MTSPYVAERIAQAGGKVRSDNTRRKYRHTQAAQREQMRAEYLTKCPCCGTRPTMRQIALRHGVTEHLVWRAVNQPIIDRFKSAHLKRSFKRISPLQVAALLCEGVDEGRASV